MNEQKHLIALVLSSGAWDTRLDYTDLQPNAPNPGSLQIDIRVALSRGSHVLQYQYTPVNAEFVAE